MQKPFFSIVVVSLNPGDRLKKTLESIVEQTCPDYEVILKDGGSKDGSLGTLKDAGFFETYPQIKVVEQKDKSIYDGMNQAVTYATGNYIQFLNCGDYFYDKTVLEKVKEVICASCECHFRVENSWDEIGKSEDKNGIIECDERVVSGKDGDKNTPVIYYGNQYNQIQDTIIYSAPAINDFTCYRNVPCHQVCFYDRRLFEKRAYDLKYRVRADYEHFLYSIYEEKAVGVSMPVIVASYEGGGFSETKENRKKSAMEHRDITEKYLGKKKVFKYRMIMWMTLAPLRTWIAEKPALSGGYNAVKRGIYKVLRK